MFKKNKKSKKRKIRIDRVIIALMLLFVIIGAIIWIIYFIANGFGDRGKDVYLASYAAVAEVFSLDDNDDLVLEDELVRGTKVVSLGDNIEYRDNSYVKIKYDDNEYYVLEENIVSNKLDVVLEDKMYVRTSVTVYENEVDSDILSFVKKGNDLEIVGYDKLLSDGSVNMYNIKTSDIEGWVYGKYLVNNEDDALLNYNENGIYDIHKDRKHSRELYGGQASTLDYYPYEKVEFEDNPLLKEAKTMYLNGTNAVIDNIDKYLDIAKNNGVNAIVVDIKDGALAYYSDVAMEYSPSAYNTNKGHNDNDVYKSAINKIKKAGIYAIGRIVVFNDVHYGKDHPEDCISSSVSDRLWPSAFSRGVWEYNVKLAKEAVTMMGFNEIQFDYVRFPEDSARMSQNSDTDFRNKYDEEKAEAVQNFLFYAADEIHKVGAYLSVDVFGECSSTYVTSYGQYWPAISNIVDVISSMPYTDHFTNYGDYSKSIYWTNPYKTIYNWAVGAATRQTEIPTPAIARTWITAYDTPYWGPNVIYDASMIEQQVQALYDAGLTGGFITWNSKSSLDKYQQIKSAFAKNYK